jgi:hypothetical protein
MSDAMPAFRAVADPSLARLGLAGAWVDVWLGDTGLILADAGDARVDIPFDAIDRARFGYRTRRLSGRVYDTRLWTHRARRPLLLRLAARETNPGYEGVARGLAAAIAARRGVGTVEVGVDWGWALACAAAAAAFVGYDAWATVQSIREGEPLWVVLIFPFIALILGGGFGYGFVRLLRPRRLSRLDQLEPFIGKEARHWLF